MVPYPTSGDSSIDDVLVLFVSLMTASVVPLAFSSGFVEDDMVCFIVCVSVQSACMYDVIQVEGKCTGQIGGLINTSTYMITKTPTLPYTHNKYNMLFNTAYR